MSIMTRAEQEAATTKLERMQKALAAAHKEAKVQGHAIASTGIQLATGAVMGAMEQYWGQGAIMGADIPAVIGVPAAVAAVFGIGGEPTDVPNMILRGVGDACLTIETYKIGGRVTADYMNRPAAGADRPAAP